MRQWLGGAGGRLRAPEPEAPIEPLPSPPSFSVVIPAYQAAATIAEAVGSVLSQSLAPHEVIVTDDGSTDDLDGALAPFVNRIEVVRQSHRGVAAARNTGCRKASGEFVLIVDADDLLLPDKLRALGALGQVRPDLDLLCTDLYFEVGGRRTGRFFEANPFPTAEQRIGILERCFAIQPAIRRSRLLGLGGFDESLSTAEDWDAALRLLLDGSLVGLNDDPLAVYRLHSGSLTDDRPQALRDRVKILEKARVNPGLRPHERGALEREIRWRRSEAIREETHGALQETGFHARLLLQAATTNVDIRARAIAVLGFVAPPLARRLLAHRDKRRS
jgi:GT2 family glycosyltransferase